MQSLLDGVVDYLPNPMEVENVALDLNENEAKVWFVTTVEYMPIYLFMHTFMINIIVWTYLVLVSEEIAVPY